MYSLYRAWLMRDAVATASLTSPPDLIITVGSFGAEINEDIGQYGYQFVAHKHLVSMHSGYLKSLIQSEPQNSEISTMNISLPNLTSESFGPLLTFMYTGYLDLTNENIYSVLLATHLLHMPRALELCRAYLVQNQTDMGRNVEYQQNLFYPHNNNFKIIKPIPSRKVLNFPQSIWSPLTNISPLLIHTRPEGPFQSISSSKKLNVSADAVKVPEIKSPLAVPSTSKNKNLSSSINETFTCDDETIHTIKPPQEKIRKRKDSSINIKKANNENIKVEYDVACCDGPIRFHRVLNENYGMSLQEIKEDQNSSDRNSKFEKISDKEYLENYPKTQFLKPKSSTHFSNFMQQQVINSNLFKKPKITKGVIQMRKIVEKEICTYDFNKKELISEENTTDGEREENTSEKVYTCIYCKHTFKSQYCYQKHAKRHLNSIEKDEEKSEKSLVNFPKTLSDSKNEKQEEEGNIKREVRLLDMNVQYYPCKTCGSKFPSYYFVHKHRKLCHSNEKTFDENSDNALEYLDSSSLERTSQSSNQ